MAVTLAQTDTAPDCSAGAYCSGLSAPGNTAQLFQAEEGGSAGSVAKSILLNSLETNVRAFFFECVIPEGYDGAAGDWTVNFNVTTAGTNCTLASVYVCRINSSCTNQETLGSATGLSTSLGSTGQKQQVVSQASGATFAAGDKVMVVLGLTNSDTMLSRTVGITPDKAIEAPGTVAVATRKTLPTTGAG